MNGVLRMNIQQIAEKLKHVLENCGMMFYDNELDELTDIDSLQFITTICEIEETFSIELHDDILKFENFYNINKIASFVLDAIHDTNS